jgi:hypothetical protein
MNTGARVAALEYESWPKVASLLAFGPGLSRRGSRVRVPSTPPVRSPCSSLSCKGFSLSGSRFFLPPQDLILFTSRVSRWRVVVVARACASKRSMKVRNMRIERTAQAMQVRVLARPLITKVSNAR